MITAIIYTRVSTDEQAEKGYSLRDQKSKLERYCLDRGIEIVKHFEDDHSAKTFERPQFKKLLEYVKQNKGLVNKLLFIKWDRFSRNMLAGMMMKQTLKKYGVSVEAIEQPLDDDIPENLLMEAIYLAAPQVENQRRSLNVTNGMRKAMLEGRYMATAPFGYKNMNNGEKKFIAPDVNMDLVQEAFKLYASGGYEKETLRKQLRKKGLTLSKQQFHEMLRNPVYCGKIRVKAYKDEPEQIVQGIHQPIISEELFHQVQQVCFNRRQIKAKPKRKIDALPLRGNLVCSKCGKNLTGSKSKGHGGEYYYYHCQSGCTERFRADYAHKNFGDWLFNITIRPEVASLYLAVMEDVFKTEEGDRNKEIQKLESERAEKNDLITRAGLKVVKDELDSNTFKKIKEELQAEIFNIVNRINDLKQTEEGFTEYSRYGFSFLSDIKTYYEQADLDIKQKIVGLIFPEKLSFSDGTYRTSKPSEVFSLMCLTGNGFSGSEKEKTAENEEQSCRVVPAGIEPASKV